MHFLLDSVISTESIHVRDNKESCNLPYLVNRHSVRILAYHPQRFSLVNFTFSPHNECHTTFLALHFSFTFLLFVFLSLFVDYHACITLVCK